MNSILHPRSFRRRSKRWMAFVHDLEHDPRTAPGRRLLGANVVRRKRSRPMETADSLSAIDADFRVFRPAPIDSRGQRT
jgi:hypothetical protein